MKTNKELLAVSTLTLAVQGALLVMFAMPPLAFAEDDEVTALTHPTNSIEVGVGNTSADSAKFGEYNGLNKSGANLIGNFNIRGGDAYSQEGSVNRWQLKGADLGTTSRELSGTVSNQGQWNLGFSYDELQHNITDTYTTPFQGSMGGNSFTLPTTFGIINTTAIAASKPAVVGPPAAAAVNNIGSNIQAIGTRDLTLAQQAAFRQVDVASTRKNSTFSGGYNFDPRWNVQFNYNHLDQSGAKLISAASSGITTGAGAAGAWAKEAPVTLMNPTNYTTDSLNLAANWAGDNAFMTASFFSSYFRNADDRLSWMNPMGTGSNASATGIRTPATTTLAGGYQLNMLSTMPGNDFNQLNLTGGYNLSPTTKLVGGLSYGRNTQNASYLVDLMQTGGLPQNSLDALVVSTHADLKLTNQTSRDLVLSAGMKYNERDNQTASNTYKFLDLGAATETSVNTPMSNSKTQLEIAGDYRLSTNNRLHLGYEYEEVKRWCNNAIANNTVGVQPSKAPAGYVVSNSSCAQIPESTENKLVAGYKLKMGEAVNFTVGYNYAQRKADVNASFYSPLQANAQGYENPGYRAFFDASRTEQLLKAGVNWQANDKLSFGLNARYLDDNYGDSPLGVQKGNSWSTNLDATYGYSENGAVSAYVGMQNRQRDLLNQAGNVVGQVIASPTLWTNRLTDKDQTLGFNATQKGLMGGKLELMGDLSVSIGKSMYHTDISGYVPTIAAPTCDNATSLACGDTPEIYSKTLQFKLTGTYQVDKKSKVAVGYMFQQLTSNDYYYNVYQYGYSSSTVLPTNQQSPNYTVNALSVSYIYNF